MSSIFVLVWGGGGWEFNESGRQKALANKSTAGHYTMSDTENIQMVHKFKEKEKRKKGKKNKC